MSAGELPSANRAAGAMLARALSTAALAVGAAAHANTYCAHTPAEFQSALDEAGAGGATNNQDNTIHLVNGTFLTSGAPFQFGSLSSFALTIDGGYNSTCTTQNLTPGITILDGGMLTRVISLQTKGDITVRHLTIQNGNYSGSAGGGAIIALNGATADAIAIFDSNVVRNNFDGYGGGSGLSLFGNGTAFVENSLFTGNSGPTVAAFSVSITVGTFYLTNNTITNNTDTYPSGSSITSLGASTATGYVSNTISYGNSGPSLSDFYMYGFENVVFVNNDYTTIDGAPAAGSAGNFISVDPRFASASDSHLKSTSPLLRAGTLTPTGGLPATDIEGHPRSVAGHVDLGAYENTDFIFANGFEKP
jgi:hypothetical protein